MIRPHCFKHSDRFGRQICDQETRLLGLGIALKQVSSLKQVKDIWKSKAACDKAGEGSKAGDPLPGERCAYVVELAFANN